MAAADNCLTLIGSRPAAQTEINLIDAMNNMAAFAPGGARLPLGPDGENLLPYHVCARSNVIAHACPLAHGQDSCVLDRFDAWPTASICWSAWCRAARMRTPTGSCFVGWPN